MNNLEGVRLSLDRAGIILDEAHNLQNRGVWNLVVRRCQEAVELALKGALQWAGLEVPRVHDVGAVLRQHLRALQAKAENNAPYRNDKDRTGSRISVGTRWDARTAATRMFPVLPIADAMCLSASWSRRGCIH